MVTTVFSLHSYAGRLVVLVLLVAVLGACGKRPSDVDWPKGAEKGSYDRVYPAPSFRTGEP